MSKEYKCPECFHILNVHPYEEDPYVCCQDYKNRITCDHCAFEITLNAFPQEDFIRVLGLIEKVEMLSVK